MNRDALSNGAIACSVLMMMYGWAQAASSEPAVPNGGEPDLDPLPWGVQDESTPSAQNQNRNDRSLIANSAPEQTNQVNWSRQQAGRLPREMESVYGKLLEQSQELAHQQQFARAVNHVTGIPKNSHHFAMAQQLQTEWSREILRQAKRHYQQARIGQALAALQAIPSLPALDAQLIPMRRQWQQQAKLIDQAIAAQAAGDWQTVIKLVRSLEGKPVYHSPLVQQLLQQAIVKLYEPDETLLQLATSGLPPLQATLHVSPQNLRHL